MVHEPLPADDPTRRCPDITLARTSLGWTPEVALRDGITRTLEHFASVLSGPSPPALADEDGSLR